MEFSSDSSSRALVSENDIRYLQSKIQSKIEKFEKENSETTYIQTFNLCDIVKDQILNYEDEPQLSKVQNNFRRIYIASELIVGICSVHDQIVDFAFTKIINDLLRLDKYKLISQKITRKACSAMRKEKKFATEAHTKLLKNLNNYKSWSSEGEEEIRRKGPASEEKAEAEKELEITNSNIYHTVNIQRKISLDEIGQTLVEDSFRDDRPFTLVGDVTEVRIEPPVEDSNLNVHTGNIPNDTSLQPAEISIREPSVQQPVEEDINEIFQHDNIITQPDIRKSGLFENILELAGDLTGVEAPQVEKLSSPARSIGIEKQIHTEESVEEWSLSTLEPVESPKKKYLRLRTDKLTEIPNYSMRAVHLNKNIEIQRIQVFEGPPRILQSMSPEYLMKTSGFKRFMSQNVRSSMLNKLYKRNLTTEKKAVEPFIMPKIRKRTMESKIPEAQLQTGLIEEIGEKVGMRLAVEESGVLADVVNEKRRMDVSVHGIFEGGTLMDVPVQRKTSPVIQPPDQEKIDNAMPIPSPRIQQLQGTVLDSRKSSPPWFFSTKEKPPRDKFREFNYVRNKLQKYWSIFEGQGMEKSISIREFLLFEEDGNFANYLTVLRVVDKLSIQRELFLECKNGDILIKPFENPHVSKEQLLLKGKEQIL